MPVFVKAGGIVPLQPATAHAAKAGSSPLTLRVFDGGDTTTVRIGPAAGTYPGAPSSRTYTVDLVDVSAPHAVLMNGRPLPSSDWSYEAATHTLAVSLGSVPTDRAVTLTQLGGSPVQADEPAATQLTIDPADSLNMAPGSTTSVSSTLSSMAPSNPGRSLLVDRGHTGDFVWAISRPCDHRDLR